MPLIKYSPPSITKPDDDAISRAEKSLGIDKNDDAPKFVTSTNNQPDDMRAEQRRIQRSGIVQAVIQSPALMQFCPTEDDYVALVLKASDKLLRYVNELEQSA